MYVQLLLAHGAIEQLGHRAVRRREVTESGTHKWQAGGTIAAVPYGHTGRGSTHPNAIDLTAECILPCGRGCSDHHGARHGRVHTCSPFVIPAESRTQHRAKRSHDTNAESSNNRRHNCESRKHARSPHTHRSDVLSYTVCEGATRAITDPPPWGEKVKAANHQPVLHTGPEHLQPDARQPTEKKTNMCPDRMVLLKQPGP